MRVKVLISVFFVLNQLQGLTAWTSSLNPFTLSNNSLIDLLNTGGYAILSADRNPALCSDERRLTDQFIRERLGNLSDDLTEMYLYSNVFGMYDGAKESSFFVILHNDAPNDERTMLYRLGEKYNQDSIIYVKRASPVIQQLIYTTGPFNGTYIEGQGYQILSTNTTDNYSTIQLCPDGSLTFTLNFDFEQIFFAPNRGEKTRLLIEHHAQNRLANREFTESVLS